VNSTAQVQNVAYPAIATRIDPESDLDLSDRKVLPAIDAGVRVGHFVIGAEFYALDRSAQQSVSRTITFDDATYPVGAAVNSTLDTSIYRLTIGYDLVRQPDLELGLALGAHITKFKLELSGQGTVAGAAVRSTEARRRSVLAPLPTIGAYGAVELAPRLMLAGRVDWLGLTVEGYHGRLWNMQAELDYRAFKNVGLGVMYRYVDYRLGVDKDQWTGRVAYRFNGPALVLRLGFR